MTLGQTLIDKASKVCGSDAELARRMGIYPADISNLRSGKRPLSPELAAELADIAGEDARQAAIDAIIERNANTRKGGALKEILGKALAGGAAAMLVFSYNGGLTSTMENPQRTMNQSVQKFDIRHIVCALMIGRWKKLVRWMRDFSSGISHQNVPKILQKTPPCAIKAGRFCYPQNSASKIKRLGLGFGRVPLPDSHLGACSPKPL